MSFDVGISEMLILLRWHVTATKLLLCYFSASYMWNKILQQIKGRQSSTLSRNFES